MITIVILSCDDHMTDAMMINTILIMHNKQD